MYEYVNKNKNIINKWHDFKLIYIERKFYAVKHALNKTFIRLDKIIEKCVRNCIISKTMRMQLTQIQFYKIL